MIYLDNAATTMRKPPQVAEAVVTAMNTMGNASRGAHAEALTASRIVYNTRVGNKGTTANLNGYLISYQASEVTSMIMHYTTMKSIVNHLFVDFVDSSSNGFHQTATSNHSIKFQGYVCLPQFVKNYLPPEILLFCNGSIRRQFFGSMCDVA